MRAIPASRGRTRCCRRERVNGQRPLYNNHLCSDPARLPARSAGIVYPGAGHWRAAPNNRRLKRRCSRLVTPFTDVVLVNQFGEKMRLYSDLIQGKVVVINSFFGACQGSCPLTNHNLERVQQALGDHIGKDLRIISISVDPTVDTPASLNEYAKRFNARTGWYFLTGDKQNVDFALRRLGQFVDNKQDHLNIIIIGNERTGLWKKAFGLAHSDELIEVVKSVLNDRSTGDK